MSKLRLVIYIENGEIVQVTADDPELLEAIVVDLDRQRTGKRWAIWSNVDPMPGTEVDEAAEEANRRLTIDEWNAAKPELQKKVRRAIEHAARLIEVASDILNTIEEDLGGVRIEIAVLAAKISVGHQFKSRADTDAFLRELLDEGREDR